jgi:spermidine/putrescine transport system substrate-binding protein
MKIKRFLSLFLAGALVFSLASCGQKPEDKGGSKEPATLTVVNWKDYGSDDADFIKKFETENNCKIVHVYMSSEEELLTKLRTSKDGEIDVCLPNCTILPSAINEGLLLPVDTAKLTNFNSLYDRFKQQEECFKDGKMYSVPWVWGSTAIAYNTDDIKEPPTSMSVLFDPKYKGKIAIRDDFNDAVMLAAIVLGQDPNKPADLDAIKEKLIEQKPLNKTYWKTGDEFSKLFAGKQISVALMWSGQAASMKQDGQPIGFVVPKDGAIGWVDTWGIAKGTKNPDLAYKFVDAVLGKDFQYNWASKGGPAPVNKDAAAKIDPAYAASCAMDEASLNRLHFMQYRSEDVKKNWNELWTEVKAD